MHFRPNLNQEQRKMCARTQSYSSHTENRLFIRGVKLKKVDKVRFLGIIIDDKLCWDAHIQHLEAKLLSSITMIKRIRKFVPKTLHKQLYYSLFQSHLTYGISAWGGACPSKLSKIFSIQKRCVRLLFGTRPSFDHSEFYETCARARPYEPLKQVDIKDFELEHTKPLFSKNEILTVHNLYKFNIITEAFKVKKLQSPILIDSLLSVSQSSKRNLLMKIPKVTLLVAQNNFAFKASQLWNNIIPHILNKPLPYNHTNLIIPGSCKNSDLSTSIGYIKTNAKKLILHNQSHGDSLKWSTGGSNFIVSNINSILHKS